MKKLMRFILAWVCVPILIIMLFMEWVIEDDQELFFDLLNSWWHWATFR